MPKECLRAQGFSEEQAQKICLVNSDNQVYKQAGNAVTVNVIRAIGERLKEVDDELYKKKGVEFMNYKASVNLINKPGS